MDAELPVIRVTYEFVTWLIPKIGKFPRDLRFTLGERTERQALLLLELLVRARYGRRRDLGLILRPLDGGEDILEEMSESRA